MQLTYAEHAPLTLARVHGNVIVGSLDVPVVEVFTAAEQRARSSQAFVRSAVGERLRVTGAYVDTVHDDLVCTVEQRDEMTGIATRSVLTQPAGTSVLRVETEIVNTSDAPIVLTAISSLTVGIGHATTGLDELSLWTADSEWLAEDRWSQQPLRQVLPPLSLPVHGQDGRGHTAVSSHGSWSTGEHLPVGAIVALDGQALAWQIDSSTGWQVDLSQGLHGGTLTLSGPTDLEHQFAHTLQPGASFTAVPVAIAPVDAGGVDAALAALTLYRRWLRRGALDLGRLPVVYNDFMNTLMGQPFTDAMRPLVTAAAERGAEIFCIDAGWFADPAIGDWWDTVGEWREHAARFDGGLRAMTDEIRSAGMVAGLWIEPEVVGVRSPIAATLPEDAFFRRFGTRVREHDRYHLDFRHPAARAHADDTIDRLVRDYDIGFVKIDYNINPGAGTDVDSTASGDGLLGHARAFQDWLGGIAERHPTLLIENCASGAMRADYGLLPHAHLQSTSDQQDHLLYPPIAASAPASILPEQCGNWAYPSAMMSDEETAFTMVTGLSGRLYLSGFLHQLRPSQTVLVDEAVAVHRRLRHLLAVSVPSWPLGLPHWDDKAIALALSAEDTTIYFVWDRSDGASTIELPVEALTARVLYPLSAAEWTVDVADSRVTLRTVPGPTARVIESRHRSYHFHEPQGVSRAATDDEETRIP